MRPSCMRACRARETSRSIGRTKCPLELVKMGIWRGRTNSCAYWHEGWRVRLVVHRDDFLCAGTDHQVRRYIKKMKGHLGGEGHSWLDRKTVRRRSL